MTTVQDGCGRARGPGDLRSPPEIRTEGQILVDPNILIGMLLGSLVAVGLVAILGGFLHYRRERLLTHAERMKALELGRDFPDDVATARLKAAFEQTERGEEGESQALARKCFSTALWVALCGFLAATGAVQSVSSGVAYAIAAATGAIGVTALICGTILATRQPAPAARETASKSPADPEAFDVVSRRG
jgi:hypothetical protein